MNYKPNNDPLYTVEHCIQEFLFEKKLALRKDSFLNYNHRMRIFLGWCEKHKLNRLIASRFTLEDAKLFHAYLITDRKLKGKTRLEYIVNLRSCWDVLKDRKIVEDNIFKKINVEKNEPEKPGKWNLTYLKQAKEYFSGNKDVLIAINLLFYCYIRPKEIVQLRTNHFDFINGTIKVTSDISKNKKRK